MLPVTILGRMTGTGETPVLRLWLCGRAVWLAGGAGSYRVIPAARRVPVQASIPRGHTPVLKLVKGFEPTAHALQVRCSTN